MGDQGKQPACSTCGKTAPGDCSRVQCARRKVVTARVSDGAAPHVAEGCYRRFPTKQGNHS